MKKLFLLIPFLFLIPTAAASVSYHQMSPLEQLLSQSATITGYGGVAPTVIQLSLSAGGSCPQNFAGGFLSMTDSIPYSATDINSSAITYSFIQCPQGDFISTDKQSCLPGTPSSSGVSIKSIMAENGLIYIQWATDATSSCQPINGYSSAVQVNIPSKSNIISGPVVNNCISENNCATQPPATLPNVQISTTAPNVNSSPIFSNNWFKLLFCKYLGVFC